MEDYLKAVYRLQETGGRVTTQSLAARLEVSPASVTSMLKRLSDLKLVVYAPYKGVELTELGRRVAVEMIRHHRLLELYLMQALGFSADEVHAEAERLEHFISEKLEEKIDLYLGRPAFDPHGSPIPTLEGEVGPVSLLEAEIGRPLEVLQSGCDGVHPGACVTVLGRPAGGRVHVKIDDRETLIERELCGSVKVRTKKP